MLKQIRFSRFHWKIRLGGHGSGGFPDVVGWDEGVYSLEAPNFQESDELTPMKGVVYKKSGSDTVCQTKGLAQGGSSRIS